MIFLKYHPSSTTVLKRNHPLAITYTSIDQQKFYLARLGDRLLARSLGGPLDPSRSGQVALLIDQSITWLHDYVKISKLIRHLNWLYHSGPLKWVPLVHQHNKCILKKANFHARLARVYLSIYVRSRLIYLSMQETKPCITSVSALSLGPVSVIFQGPMALLLH